MSNIIRRNVQCAVCGKISKQPIILSTSTFGGSDLDGRPHGMARRLLSYMLQECDYCGYVNYNIEEAPQQSFNECEIKSNSFFDLSFRYYKFAKYNERIGKNLLALKLYLSAAWVCDDESLSYDDCHREKAALKMRTEVVRIFETYQDVLQDLDTKIILVDVYRRTGNFEKAISLINDIGVPEKETLNTILVFQRELCNKKDDKCHNTNEIFPNR